MASIETFLAKRLKLRVNKAKSAVANTSAGCEAENEHGRNMSGSSPPRPHHRHTSLSREGASKMYSCE
jgi:hypothetical protein